MSWSTFQLQFLAAAAELTLRQRELVRVVEDAMGVSPYDYWVLGHGCNDARLEAISSSRDGMWRFQFHGLEFDAVNVQDGRSVRVDFGAPREVAFTPGGVGAFVMRTNPPWREFPVLRAALVGESGTDCGHRLCASLADSLRTAGFIDYAAPDLVALIASHTRFVPGRGQVEDIPAAARPDPGAALLTCDNLVLTRDGEIAAAEAAV